MFDSILSAIIVSLLIMSCSSPSKERAVASNDTSKVAAPVDQKSRVSNDSIATGPQIFKLHPHLIQLQNGDSFYLEIPGGYRITVAAETGTRLRFLRTSPDGRLFATDMHDRTDNKKGRVLLFENWSDSSKTFSSVRAYLTGLHNPNQVAFYKDWIYVAQTGKLVRYRYENASQAPGDTGHVIARFPEYGLSYKYGGWHLTRSLAFHGDKLYVSVGSSCNACLEKEKVRAVMLEMNPDGTGEQIFARGLRNSVGIKWIGEKLWATGMGRDLIGPDRPEDLFQEITKGEFYGWPFYYQFDQKIYADPQFKDSSRTAWISQPPKAFLGFKAHSAPLGFDYFKNFADKKFSNSVLVCLHGSTSAWRQRGNGIVRVERNNTYTEVVRGFLAGKNESERHGRPCDILMKDDHSFYFTDDLNGVLYYVWKEN